MSNKPTRYTVRYIPIQEGQDLQLGSTGLPNIWGSHKLIGYHPAPLNPRARKSYQPSGWLIVLVNEAVTDPRPKTLRKLPSR